MVDLKGREHVAMARWGPEVHWWSIQNRQRKDGAPVSTSALATRPSSTSTPPHAVSTCYGPRPDAHLAVALVDSGMIDNGRAAGVITWLGEFGQQ